MGGWTAGVVVILAAVVRTQFDTDAEWRAAYPHQADFEPPGASAATPETEMSGTWVGSSHLWASAADRARLGELLLRDGIWRGERIMAPGWLDLAARPALPSGEGYGAQTRLPADPVGGECRNSTGLLRDALAMAAHRGQILAIVPSRDAVAVRLGWTFDSDRSDGGRFVGEVVSALP